MNRELRFGFEKTTRDSRLRIEGPASVMNTAFETIPHQRHAPLHMSASRVFPKTKSKHNIHTNNDTIAWGFNAALVGRMRPHAQEQHILGVNSVISALVKATARGDVRHDERLKLLAYDVRGHDATIAAEVDRPETAPKEVMRIVGAYTSQMACELNLYPQFTQYSDYDRHIQNLFYYGRSGLSLGISHAANLHASGADWDYADPTYRLISNEVRSGKESIVALAALVAFAHVDEL